MSFDDEVDPHDPLIARAFEQLDDIQAPELGSYPPEGHHHIGHWDTRPLSTGDLDAAWLADDGPSPTPIAEPDREPATVISPRFGRGDSDRDLARPAYLLGAAAAFVAIAGLSVWALSTRSAPLEVDATDVGVDQDAATSDASPRNTLQVVTDDESDQDGDGAGSADDGSGDGDGDGSSAERPDGGDGASAGEAEADAGQSSDESTPETTVPATSSTTPVDEDGSSSTTETAPSSVPPSSSSTTEVTLPDTSIGGGGGERPFIISGIATEVFTDCMSHLVLNDGGGIDTVSPVSCDGGSYIVVNNNRIYTSAGFVAGDLYFDKHMPELRPGQSVIVTVVQSEGARPLSLNCVRCEIRLGG